MSVLCADGRAQLAATCTASLSHDRDGQVLTIRDGEGGFRRFRLTADGRGVVAADGAEPARVRVVGRDAIEVAIGNTRYRLPATIAPTSR